MTSDISDVLIVGAGPVGMLLAILLHDQGIKVKIVERQRALYPLPRAVAFDHESRRLFGIAGLGDAVATILEERNLKGGEDGQNFVWRDADLKRESLAERLLTCGSRRRPPLRSPHPLRLPHGQQL